MAFQAVIQKKDVVIIIIQMTKFKKSFSKRNKPILIINDAYIYNFISISKTTKTEIYRCKEYKNKYFCSAKIKLKDDEIIEANKIHNHKIDHTDILKEQGKL